MRGSSFGLYDLMRHYALLMESDVWCVRGEYSEGAALADALIPHWDERWTPRGY